MEDDYPCPNSVPYSFPVVKVRITKCSTYAVVSRLKSSPAETITVSGRTFAHPDYPEDTITVPEKAVETETKLSLQLKVGCLGYWVIHHYSSCGTLYVVIWWREIPHESRIVTEGMNLESSWSPFKEMRSNVWAAVQFCHRLLCHLNLWCLLLFNVWFVQLPENLVKVGCTVNYQRTSLQRKKWKKHLAGFFFTLYTLWKKHLAGFFFTL